MKKIIYAICFVFVAVSCAIAAPRVRNITAVSAKTNSLPAIVLDAGHGGFDGGAEAVDGTWEKDINLAIALKTRDCIEDLGFDVIMTRDTDTGTDSPGLSSTRERKVSDIHNRMELMKSAGNCLFVSIHQNFFSDASCHGAQIFYSGNDKQSREVAQALQQDIARELQPDNTRQIKQSGSNIYLLYNAQKPAVLIECGFISNQNDTELLTDEEYQQRLASVIAESLYHYYVKPEAENGTQE